MVLLTPASAMAQAALPLEQLSEPATSGMIAEVSDQPAQGADPTAVEAVQTSGDTNANASPDNSTPAPPDALGLVSSSTNSRDLLPIEPPAASESLLQTPLAQATTLAETPSTPPQSEQWHFLVVPYIYVPFNISGSANFKDTEEFRNRFSRDFGASGNVDASRDFEFTPSQIRQELKDSLNFAFLGGIEAWSPNYTLGFLANLEYVSLTNTGTFTREVRRPGLANFIPTELNASVNTQLWYVNLAASYRFYDPAKVNPEGSFTEFDLGPLVFDVLGGLNIVSLNNQLGLSTNLGGDGTFSTSQTIVSPLVGGRFRWNANPKLAVLLGGSISGFGISGLTQYSLQGGIDWLFSGNTSLGAGYRFGFLNQSSSLVDLNVNQNGPYLDIGFRF